MKFFPFIFVFILNTALFDASAQSQGTTRFSEWDRNQDGTLTPAELPESLRKNFSRVDRNGDGKISLEEHLSVGRRGSKGGGAQTTPSLEVKRDIAYADNENPRQTLDLYLPGRRDNESLLPVVCWIHGGGWKSGNKSSGERRLETLVSTGNYAGVAIGYRLSGEAKWPAQIHDCKAAIRWIRAHAEDYSLDPDKIAVWGSSAGGHLVAMLGVSADASDLEGDIGNHLGESSAVSCVVNFFGPTDFLTMNEQGSRIDHDSETSPESLLIGGAIQQLPEKVETASPLAYVSETSTPFLIVHGTADPLVPYQQSAMLHEALLASQVETSLITVQDGGHGKGFGATVQRLVEDFLSQQLLGAPGNIESRSIPAE